MADIEIHRAHDLGMKAARAAAEKMADHLGRKFDLKGDWSGNVLRFERPGVSGSLTVGEKDVSLSVALGFLLKAMKGSIEGAVRHEMDKLFAEKPSPRPSPKAEGEKTTAKKAAPRPKKGG